MFRFTLLAAVTICYTYAASTNPKVNLKCGVHKPGGLVAPDEAKNVSVKHAGLGEYPWTVAIFKGDTLTCTGSLIQRNVVLTASHCLKSLDKKDIKIKAGLWNTIKSDELYPVQESTIKEVILHPDYSDVDGKPVHNDIALLVLETPVKLADHIGLTCLAKKDENRKASDCHVAGWGQTPSGGELSKVLKELSLPIVEKDQCEKKLKDKVSGIKLDDKAICAGGDKDATCMGDGGAGLVCQLEGVEENRLVEIGVTSWGVGCKSDLPGVYTRVGKYREWIDEQINRLNLTPDNYTV